MQFDSSERSRAGVQTGATGSTALISGPSCMGTRLLALRAVPLKRERATGGNVLSSIDWLAYPVRCVEIIRASLWIHEARSTE